MDYFEKVMKFYIGLALERAGVKVDFDMQSVLDSAFVALRKEFDQLRAEVVALKAQQAE